jgi:hypothetical protein
MRAASDRRHAGALSHRRPARAASTRASACSRRKNDRPTLIARCASRIDAAAADPRYRFMFGSQPDRGQRSTRRSATFFACRMTDARSPASRWRGLPSEGRQLRLLGARAPGLRPGAVGSQGKLQACCCHVRGGAPLHAGGPAPRVRADPPRAVAHRQGGPQVRLLPRHRDPAPPASSTRPSCRSARPSSPCASSNETRPGHRPLGGVADSSASTLSPSSPPWASARRSPSARAWRRPCA